MLGVLQHFLYYRYQKFDHKVATVFAILFHFKFLQDPTSGGWGDGN